MNTFTVFHVMLSLAGILAGFVVAFGLLNSKPLPVWTAVFLWSTVATSVTGFFFPFQRFLPSHATGVLSLLILPVSFYALYARHLAGAWRWVYVLTALFALYLNFFVLIVQLFLKVPFIHALAPTQGEPPFLIAQVIALIFFASLSVVATRKFHPQLPLAA